MSNIGEVHTTPKELDLDVEWKINRFFLLRNGLLYSSPQFSFNEHIWCLGICKRDDRYELFHKRISVGPTIIQAFSIALKTLSGQKMYEMHCCADNVQRGIYHKLPQTINRYDILKRYAILVPSGILTVVCTMKMAVSGRSADNCNILRTLIIRRKTESVTESTSDDCSILHTRIITRKRKSTTESTSESEQPEKLPKMTEKERSEKLSNDLKEMMLSGDHSDTTIRVKGEDFKLHRSILCARNPYFHSMFKTEMLEKATGIVSIDDCEPDVFRSFIHFLYTGKVDEQSLENVCDLYEIADKYQENDLKADCLDLMKNNLSVDNFCDFTALALKYDEKELLEIATNFFCIEVKQIIRCVKWQAFLKEHSTQANELYIKAIDSFDDIRDNFRVIGALV